MNTTRDVTAFGAVGDGVVANEGPALQAALDDAYAAGLLAPDVHTVTVPAGVYLLQQRLLIGSHTQLLMDPAAEIRWNTNLATHMLRVRNTAPVYGYAGEHDWSVEGGTINGNYLATGINPGASLVSFSHCERVTFRDLTIKGCQVNHILEINASRQVLCERVRFDEMGPDKEAVQIDYAYSGGYPSFGAYDLTHCDDVRLLDCTWGLGCYTAVGNHAYSSGRFHTGIKILGGFVDNVRGEMFKLDNCPDLEIDIEHVNNGNSLTFRNYGPVPPRRRLRFSNVPV